MARGRTLYFPIWLAYATGALEERYKDVRLVDAVAWNWDRHDVLRDVNEFKPDLAVIDSNFASLSNDVNMARLVKETVASVKTVLVGPPASQFTDRILGSGGIDIIAKFEYDFTVRDIAQALENNGDFDSIKGISYTKEGKIIHNPDREFADLDQLDGLPFVSRVYRKHLNIKDYYLDHTLYPEVQILTSRGCPNQCTFCSWPQTLTGRNYRVRSVSNVVDEFEYIASELPQVREIFIDDGTFTIDKKRIIAICQEINRRKLSIKWSCNARANLDYETMKIMKKANCRLLDVGYESGSDDILKNVKKGIDTNQMRRFAREARQAGLMVLGDFIFGLPGETNKTAEQTIRFARELKPNLAQFAVATPIPGTEFHSWAKKNGHLLTDNLEESLDSNGFQKSIVSYPEFTNHDVESYVDKALKGYYLSPSYITIALENILRRDGWRQFKSMMRSARVFLRYLRREKGYRQTYLARVKEIRENEVTELDVSQHAKVFDDHYHQWGYVRDVNEYIHKRGDNKILSLYTHHSVKDKVLGNLSIRDNKIRIVDVGCGYGFLIQKLVARYSGGIELEMYGTDISTFMIENARRNVPQGVFETCPAECLPFEDCSFDNVVCSEVIEHVIDAKKVIQELSRVACDGGHVIITTPNYSGYALVALRFLKNHSRILVLRQLGLFLQKYSDFRVKNEEIPLRQLKALIRESNLSLVKTIYLVPLVEQRVFLPTCERLWSIMIRATRFLEKVPLVNRIACNQAVLVTVKRGPTK